MNMPTTDLFENLVIRQASPSSNVSNVLGVIWNSVILMKLSFMLCHIQMSIVNAQKEARYEKSVIFSDSCYFSFLSDY